LTHETFPHYGIPEMTEESEKPKRGVVTYKSRNDAASEAFSRLGIDVDDVDDMRELSADLYFIRRMRQAHQSRINMTWTSAIAAIVSAIVGAAGVVITNLLHKGTP